MKNYIVTYDLNGRVPTHHQMDHHLRTGFLYVTRVLETVWLVKSDLPAWEVGSYVNRITSPNDSVLVVNADEAFFRNLLVTGFDLQTAWAA